MVRKGIFLEFELFFLFTYLDREDWVVLLEQEIPHIQLAIHFGGEEDRGSLGAPAGICQVVHVIVGPHDRTVFDVLRPDLKQQRNTII